MRKVALLACLVVAAALQTVADDSNLSVLEGRFLQTTDYVYRLTLEPEGRTLDANVALLDPVDQPWYRVTIHEQSITASTGWSSRRDTSDADGNRVTELDWSGLKGGTEVIVERHVRATSEALYGAISLPDPFPVSTTLLPRFCRDALAPTDQAQCDNPTLSALAEAITESSPTQLDAVVRVLSWIRREVEYACSKDLCDPVYRTDALFTVEKKKGNCVSYAHLATALLRAAGIPTVEASGFVADREASSACHAWIAVFFPSTGWIEFESADWMPAYREAPITFLMPQHLTIRVGGEEVGISHAAFSERHEASFEIAERPEPRTAVAGRTSGGVAIAWVITVKSPTTEDALLRLSAEGAPPGWIVALSERLVAIGENDVSRTVDVLVTVIPSGVAADGTSRIAVVCEHEGAEVGRVTFDVAVGD
jgi:transglutaminase-like putative cysteine protease